MKRRHEFPPINTVAICICSALLLFLFIFPGQYLKKMTDSIIFHADAATRAALAGDWAAATASVAAAQESFDAGKDIAKLILDHEDVDELDALINSSIHLAQVQDAAEIAIQLERVRSTAAFMAGIETFDFADLI